MLFFRMNSVINNYLNIFVYFLDDVTPLTHENNFKIILSSKVENLRILRLSELLGSHKKCEYGHATC